MTSLSGVTMDSTKVLTEKLTLARELSALRPELDHLRSQALSSQSLLAEKLTLQRHVSTLQVELENEKRSTQRWVAKEGKSHMEDSILEARLEAVEAELAKEKREKQNVDREAQKSRALFDNKITVYESRLDAFRSKLKSTKDSLKDMQMELQKSQINGIQPVSTAVSSALIPRNTRKRTASEMDADTVIGTPGDLIAIKGNKTKLTMPGEKSTFSITPFLNKTASVAPASSPQIEDKSNDEEDLPTGFQSPSRFHDIQRPSRLAASRTITKKGAEDKCDLTEKGLNAVAEKGKLLSGRLPSKKSIAAPRLPQVDEEGVGPLATSQARSSKVIEDKSISEKTVHNGQEKKKVKRKILGSHMGRTLFDDDDGDNMKGNRRIGAARASSILGKGGLVGARDNTGGPGGYGPFSPLKKDRRAAVV